MRATKNPAPLLVRGSSGDSGLFLVTWSQPSARTSVANKKDEYEGNEEGAERKRQPFDRDHAGREGEAAGDVALRHGSNLEHVAGACQQLSYESFF